MTVTHITPGKDRYRKNAKDLYHCTSRAIGSLDNRVSGFLVLVWDDRGATAGSSKGGGIISHDAIPVHVQAILATME